VEGESQVEQIFARSFEGGFDAQGWAIWRTKDADWLRLGVMASGRFVCSRPVHVNNAAGFEQSGCVHLPYAMYSSSAEEGSMWAPFANDWATTCPTYPGE
jgi:hypothetical protein